MNSSARKDEQNMFPNIFKLTNLDISFVSGCPKGANPGAIVMLKKENVMDKDEKKTPVNVNIDTETLGKSISDNLKKSLDELLEKQGKELDTAVVAETVTAVVTGDVNKAVADVQAKLTEQLAALQKEMDEKLEAAKKEAGVNKDGDETCTINGTTFAKSAVGEATFAALKASAEQVARLQKEAEHRDMVARVEKEYPNVTGSPDVKARILALIEKADDETKAGGLAILKALNESSGKFGKEEGSNANSNVNKDVDYKKFATDDDATDKLDALAKEYAKKNNVSYNEAYNSVLETPEGEALYAEHMNR